MKTITINKDRTEVVFENRVFESSCNVRTNLSAAWCRRRLHMPSQVHLSTNADGSDGKPVMPAVFPTGTWNVIDVRENDLSVHPDLGPVVVRTDVHQSLRVWALDEQGGYDHETDETVEDWGYEIHFDGYKPDGGFSVGCVHISEESEQIEFANMVKAALADGPVQVVAE